MLTNKRNRCEKEKENLNIFEQISRWVQFNRADDGNFDWCQFQNSCSLFPVPSPGGSPLCHPPGGCFLMLLVGATHCHSNDLYTSFYNKAGSSRPADPSSSRLFSCIAFVFLSTSWIALFIHSALWLEQRILPRTVQNMKHVVLTLFLNIQRFSGQSHSTAVMDSDLSGVYVEFACSPCEYLGPWQNFTLCLRKWWIIIKIIGDLFKPNTQKQRTIQSLMFVSKLFKRRRCKFPDLQVQRRSCGKRII